MTIPIEQPKPTEENDKETELAKNLNQEILSDIPSLIKQIRLRDKEIELLKSQPIIPAAVTENKTNEDWRQKFDADLLDFYPKTTIEIQPTIYTFERWVKAWIENNKSLIK